MADAMADDDNFAINAPFTTGIVADPVGSFDGVDFVSLHLTADLGAILKREEPAPAHNLKALAEILEILFAPAGVGVSTVVEVRGIKEKECFQAIIVLEHLLPRPALYGRPINSSVKRLNCDLALSPGSERRAQGDRESASNAAQRNSIPEKPASGTLDFRQTDLDQVVLESRWKRCN